MRGVTIPVISLRVHEFRLLYCISVLMFHFLVQKRIFIFFIILIIPSPSSAHLNNLLNPASLVTTLLTQMTLVNLVHIAILLSTATLFNQKGVLPPLPATRPHQQIIVSTLVFFVTAFQKTGGSRLIKSFWTFVDV